MSESHYVSAYAPSLWGGRLQKSLCGRYVDPLSQHATQPNCIACATAIAEEDAHIAELLGRPVLVEKLR